MRKTAPLGSEVRSGVAPSSAKSCTASVMPNRPPAGRLTASPESVTSNESAEIPPMDMLAWLSCIASTSTRGSNDAPAAGSKVIVAVAAWAPGSEPGLNWKRRIAGADVSPCVSRTT